MTESCQGVDALLQVPLLEGRVGGLLGDLVNQVLELLPPFKLPELDLLVVQRLELGLHVVEVVQLGLTLNNLRFQDCDFL